MSLLAVAVVVIGLLSAIDLLRTIAGLRGVRAYGDEVHGGGVRPTAATLRPAAFHGQAAGSDVIDSAA